MLGGGGTEVCNGEEGTGNSFSSTNGLGRKKNAGKQLDLASMFRRYNIIKYNFFLASLVAFILFLALSCSAQKRPSKKKDEETSNGVDHEESNGDIEPAAKRPKHEPTTNGHGDESCDQTSSENLVKIDSPKKEVSDRECCILCDAAGVCLSSPPKDVPSVGSSWTSPPSRCS